MLPYVVHLALALGTSILKKVCLFSQEGAHIYWKVVYFHNTQEGAHTVFNRIETAATIIFSIVQARLLIEGGSYSRVANIY